MIISLIIFLFIVTVVPYCVGFFALCFWWRWWLLLPASAVALLLKFSIRFGLPPDEPEGGPILITSADIEHIVTIGAVCGFMACCVITIGRATELRFTKPVFVLPIAYVIGVASILVRQL